jgi:WD40 repeat protein
MAFAPSPPEGSERRQLLFSGSADRTVRLWDASARRQLKAKKLPAEVTAISAIRRVRPPGEPVIAATDNSAQCVQYGVATHEHMVFMSEQAH